jgi:hypothetical protein
MLFDNLEFTGFKNPAIPVAKLVNVDSSQVILQIDRGITGDALYFGHSFTYKIENVQRVCGLILAGDVETNEGYRRIRIEADHFVSGSHRNIPTSLGRSPRGSAQTKE